MEKQMTGKADPQGRRQWWTYGYLWLVIAGPAAVVVAGIATVWLALAYPETVLAVDASPARKARPLMPALQGRNHAATPAPGARGL
jgi:hypothetical protein